MGVDDVTNDLFTLVRKCYNQGSDSMRKKIVENCVSILADSLNNERDSKALFETYNHIKMGNFD